MAPFDTDAQIAQHTVREILSLLGEDPSREGLRDTPKRVVNSWKKLYGGYGMKAEDVLSVSFQESGEYDELILLKDIAFYSTCEHHMLPFYGKVHVAYIPNKGVVGISKLARLVEIHARRLQIQERMTADIAADIERILKPVGVAVLIEAQHFCIRSRGVEKQDAIMVTSKLTGAFRSKPEARAEFFTLVRGSSNG